jgi:hypothetical protein
MHQQLLWFCSRFRQILRLAIEWIGRHQSVIIVFPSIWLFTHYKPFWKDVDVVAQLITAPGSLNILHFPPIYCFLARLPFWLTDTLSHGAASPIFAEQHPSSLAVWMLIRQRLSLQLFIVALSFLAIGTIADLATCALAYAQPRYTLPLLITVFVSGCVLLFGTNGTNRILPWGISFRNRSVRSGHTADQPVSN